MPQPTTFQRIERLLTRHGVSYDVLRHEPVFTSQQAADARGTPLSSGAKALIVKLGDAMKLLVIPADRKLASRQVRTHFSARRVRFASAEEVLEITGLKPGSIPPFGSLFGLPTICDPKLADNPTINFNAGDHAISISMAYDDYLVAEQPTLADISES